MKCGDCECFVDNVFNPPHNDNIIGECDNRHSYRNGQTVFYDTDACGEFQEQKDG